MADRTANERYTDAAIMHQIAVRRFTNGEIKRILKILEAADRDLAAKIRRSAAKFQGRRAEALLESIRDERAMLVETLRGEVEVGLRGLSVVEATAELRILETSIPIEINFAKVPVETLRALVTDKPFDGQLLHEWFDSLTASDKKNLMREIRLGIVEGQSIQGLAARVAGTKKNGFRDGVLAITRRNAETVVRTAVNHVSNAAREEVWAANEDVVTALRWVSTLDGRTTPICQSRDGKVVPSEGHEQPAGTEPWEPAGASPPAHPNCRSVKIAYFDGSFVAGERPFVRDTRTGKRRQLDFAKEARAAGQTTKQYRDEWADKNIGRVPAKTTYNEWLKNQSASFQDDVLGKAKGQMFRSGKVTLDQFVDSRGKELTLAQLGAL